jgi:DNA topoisomerase IA
MCARSGELGRDYLARIEDRHLSFAPTRRARVHLLAHFDDPLAEIPDDDPELGELLTRIVSDEGPEQEAVLRMTFLQLEQRWIKREIRRAAEGGEVGRQDELAEAWQEARRQLDTLMGQAV